MDIKKKTNSIDEIKVLKAFLKKAQQEENIDKKKTLIKEITHIASDLFINKDTNEFKTENALNFKLLDNDNKEFGIRAYTTKYNGGYQTILGVRYKDLIVKIN